jgi:apolipoprotein D and lipocalin family protein
MKCAFDRAALLVTSLLALGGCSAPPPVHTVERVDVPRFMGDWYVIANIPTFIERDAHNAIESYTLAEDGRVLTRFTFRKGGFDGPPKEYRPVGFVRDESGAVWGMQFVWPIKAEYRVMYVDEAYTQTIVGRSKRDYVWIMARSPIIPDADYARHVSFLQREGYDVSKLQKVPQRH